MSDDVKPDPPTVSGAEKRREVITFYADIALKLSPVIATLVLGFVTYQFQSKNAAATLLNQREQAETQLRSNLFENLLAPIGGSAEAGLDPERQRLFVELLMLNFHQHIEFKPLLIHTDQRLANELRKSSVESARRSLQPVARRVRDRQASQLAKDCAMLLNEARADAAESENRCFPQTERFLESEASNEYEGKQWEVASPDDRYKLFLRVLEMDWKQLEFPVDIEIWKSQDGAFGFLDTASFTITPFDLPFTDYMALGDGHRLALGVSYIAPRRELPATVSMDLELMEGFVEVQVVWFPHGYSFHTSVP